MNAWFEKIKQFNWKQTDRAAPVLLILLIVYVCWTLASFFWLWIAPPQVMQVERVKLGAQQPQIPNISAFALFQEVGKSAAVNDNINLVLQGVLVASPKKLSSAVIQVNAMSERYRMGETISTTAYQLVEVYWDRVVLRQNNGVTRELSFKHIEHGLDQSIVQPVPNTAMANQQADGQNNQVLGQAVQHIQEDREQYLKNMGVNSTSDGYEVTAKTPAALRSQLGLQAGDRIISVNGQAVGQGQNDAQLLQQARREGQVKLEIKRGDQVMTLQQDF